MALDGRSKWSPCDRMRLPKDCKLWQHCNHVAALHEREHRPRVVDPRVNLRLEAGAVAFLLAAACEVGWAPAPPIWRVANSTDQAASCQRGGSSGLSRCRS